MKSKTWTILFSCILGMLIITFMSFALTYGRFSEEKESSGGSYGSDIEYIVADQIEVRNEDEFIGAIENGYSNITISDEAEGSLIITSGVTDVGVDLIINLNGHKVVRNNRNPMLNIKEGVRLTIIDTSAEKAGTFYNPVGSVLMISGGTLTVSGGIFESGPRKTEYGASANLVSAQVFQKKGDTYISQGNLNMPKLDGTQTGVYFTSGINSCVTSDTYLYYTKENVGDSIVLKPEEGSADFYYQYEDNGAQIVVYGYNKVKELAADENTKFSIVSMLSGNMYARGGEYKSYFGAETSYGIYADGGYMAVETGKFSVIEDGTCIRCDYDSVSDKEYLRIADGTFQSEWGDTVQVNGGKLAVTGGQFQKDASSAPEEEKGSAVLRVTGGILDGTGTHTANLNFILTGSNLYGIYAQQSGSELVEVDIETATFQFQNGTENIGVYTDGGNVLLNNTNIKSADLGIYVNGGNIQSNAGFLLETNAVAIKIEGGDLTLGSNAKVDITSGIGFGNINQDVSWGTDSIAVSGGSLISYGTLNITHTGVLNDNTQYTGNNGDTLYRDFLIQSFAVRVETIGSEKSEIEIRKGNIINSCGGGIYVGADTLDTTVVLGEQDKNNLTVETTGNVVYEESSNNGYVKTSVGGNWDYKQNKTGGHAVEVSGGTLTVYNGIYSAAQGEGILVRGGTAAIYGGTFNGNDNYTEQGGSGPVAGPAASYSFKMYGGTADIYGGVFGQGSTGSGAFIMGEARTLTYADANIYGGTFDVKGQAGFSIYEYGDVLFAPKQGVGGTGGEIYVSGLAAGIVIEGNTSNPAKLEIKGGIFTSTRNSGNSDGIWYNNSNSILTISGGTFMGAARSGLYFAIAPNGGIVQLSGGKYIGANSKENEHWIYGSYWDYGAISVTTSRDWLGRYNGLEIQVGNILQSGYKMLNGQTAITSGLIHTDVSKYKEIEIIHA